MLFRSYADPDELAHEYPGVELGAVNADHPVDALVMAVAHQEYAALAATDIKTLLKSPGAVVADVKGLFDPDQLKQAGICAWRL